MSFENNDPWEELHAPSCNSRFLSTCGDNQSCDCPVKIARAAVEAQHQRDRELLMNTILKQDAEIERLTQERDKYRNGFTSSQEQIEALLAEVQELRDRDRVLSHQLERRADGMDAMTQALRAERDALAAQIAAAEGDAVSSREASMRWQARAETAEAQVAGLREALRDIVKLGPRCDECSRTHWVIQTAEDALNGGK